MTVPDVQNTIKNEDNASEQNIKLHIIKKRTHSKVSFVEFRIFRKVV